LLPLALILVMGILWGASISLAKIATEGGAHPFGLSFWQGLGGGSLLLALCWARRRVIPLDRPHLTFYLVCGLIGSSIPGTLLFFAAPRLPAGIVSITIATIPVFTYGIAFMFRAEGFSPRRVLGILLGLVAIVILIAPEASLPEAGMAPWVLVALLSCLFYTFENIYVALRRPEMSDSLVLVCGMLFMGALTISPLMIMTGTFVPLGVTWSEVELSVLGMIMMNSLAYAIFLHVVQTSGPVFASQTAYSVTLAGILWGMLIFGERHSLWIWLSLIVMLAGLSLVAPRETKVEPSR
jgi:drug/metabolite transporter (DMT)-like permease